MRFDFENDEIILTYNENGFTPFNVFAITGIAEAAKNISSEKDQIGEKGIGFKSVFGVADRVWIRSGWFSFVLHKENFTIPVPIYNDNFDYCNGTQMTLYVPGKAKQIYNEIKRKYCKRDALFSRNPLLFLNKLTSLKFHFDSFRSMEFHVSRAKNDYSEQFKVEKGIIISVELHDYENGSEINLKEEICCTRYTYYAVFSKEACRSRYGEKTLVGQNNGKAMSLSAIIPDKEFISEVGNGALYSFLPTQIKLTVPIVCHVPFKLDASREFVDPQDNNLWFREASNYLSEMMDRVYLDYSHAVKENILRYLPDKSKSIFAVNNGKEECLTKQKIFVGAHYLELPIFYTVDDDYKNANDIFCFNESENIIDPERVYRLMGFQHSLFLAPVSVSRFSIKIVNKIKHKMFKKALVSKEKTSDILDYLDTVNYDYPQQLIQQLEPIVISQAQLEIIICHKKLLRSLNDICCDYIRTNRRFRLEITDANELDILNIFKDEFEISDIPKDVRNYMDYCHQKCICIDNQKDIYLPCFNLIMISAQNPLSSFLSFCRNIDPNDPFTTRIAWREKSNELNKYVEDSTISKSEYMRVLRQIRLSIRDSLGEDGYKSYLDIILKSGTDKGRFIQEILQNADDCLYSKDITPTFSLSVRGQTIVTEYNEIGFSRANIRSITAIGESTKNKLLYQQSNSIGEKGVGFKTIFAIASKVTIHSGDYHFSLSSKEPTIPKLLEGTNIAPVAGTRMEIMLKNIDALPAYKEREILELCLCLRNLKKLTIGKHEVVINDTEDLRTISIGNRKYVFKRFYHKFTITDEQALEERKNGSRNISAEQQIVCYVPENAQAEYPLYCGLPTKHKIRVPLAIDAPFSLTTSREEIETEGSRWNDFIRTEMYISLLNVIDSLKKDERAKVFRFLRFAFRFQGNSTAYVNEIFDNKYLNGFDLLGKLRMKEVLPTFNNNYFAVPNKNEAYRFPEFAINILEELSQSENEVVDPSSIIDTGTNDYDSTLKALGCKDADFSVVFRIIFHYAERFIRNTDFSKALYEYLSNCSESAKGKYDEYLEEIKKLKIIPVYGSPKSPVSFISWKDDSIFVKPGTFSSGNNYYVLNVEIMPKYLCEKIYCTNINEMNSEYEHDRYNKMLKDKILSDNDFSAIYNFLISEYHNGNLLKHDSFTLLSAYKIPLKNQSGEITDNDLFVSDKKGYFVTEMILEITVHDECWGLAKDIGIKPLSEIHYEDIQYNEKLTADDVESLIDEPYHYFTNYEEILRGFYRDGLLPDELLHEYDLDYISYGSYDIETYSYDFPSNPVGNRAALSSHIRKIWNTPTKIITVEELCKVQKIKTHDGKIYSYDRNYSRNIMLNTYSPIERSDLCFCQMCNVPKPKGYIEVNNIEKSPEYFFTQLRIALCLECSKKFESFRQNESIRKDFLNSIQEYNILLEGTIEIPIGSNDTITFTAKHLAEIQEILKQGAKLKKFSQIH